MIICILNGEIYFTLLNYFILYIQSIQIHMDSP